MNEAKYYVYRHIRLDKNEPFYIGIGTIYDNIHEKSRYRRAYNKVTRNNIWKKIINKTEYEVEIIYLSDNESEIKQKEKEFIALYGRIDLGTGILCNMTEGGDGVRIFGRIPSSETLLKMSLAKLGKKRGYDIIWSNDTKKKMSEKCKTKIGSLNNFYGRAHTEEYKIKRSVPIIQYNLNNEYINKFYGLSDAAIKTGSTISLIHKVCKGERKTHNNFIWKYKNK